MSLHECLKCGGTQNRHYKDCVLFCTPSDKTNRITIESNVAAELIGAQVVGSNGRYTITLLQGIVDLNVLFSIRNRLKINLPPHSLVLTVSGRNIELILMFT